MKPGAITSNPAEIVGIRFKDLSENKVGAQHCNTLYAHSDKLNILEDA